VAIRVRRIGPHEGPLLRAARLRAVSDAPAAFGSSTDELRVTADAEWSAAARAASAGPARAWFLAEGPTGIVGIVQGRRRPPDTLLVFSMWVAPEVRRTGVGRALIEAVERWAAGWGARRSVLWVVVDNAGARRFYERLGFEVVRDGPDAESATRHASVAMTRPVTWPVEPGSR
jgi:GNAT superfamily N-acetyltransferase